MNTVATLLSTDDIALGIDVSDKEGALEQVASIIGQHHELKPAPLFRALWRREQVGSTGVGHGVAIPHARLCDIHEPIVFLMRTKLAIEFGAPDHNPVDLLFVILVPEHANTEHLAILATVAQIFSVRDFRDQIRDAVDSDVVARLFAEASLGPSTQ